MEERGYVSDELEQIEQAKAELDRRSEEIRRKTSETYVRDTVIGLQDPSKPLAKNFCAQCGQNHAEPFGPHTQALKLQIGRVLLEVYGCAGLILMHECGVTVAPAQFRGIVEAGDGIVIYDEGNITISTRRSTGLGASGQLGYTRSVIALDKQ